LNSAAFSRAEWTRRRSRPASAPQLAGIEEPEVNWSHQASDAITRLLKNQPAEVLA